MRSRRDFLKVLGAALGAAALPGAVVEAAERCRTPADEADLLEAVLGKREAYAVRSTVHPFVAQSSMVFEFDAEWLGRDGSPLETTSWRLVSPFGGEVAFEVSR